MGKLFFSFLFLYLMFSSCSFNPHTVYTGEAFLQGYWEEDSVVHEGKLVSYEKYKFRFTCDSFYLDIHNFSKVNLDAGECYSGNNWYEYAKGTYIVDNDTLKLNGAYVSENYRYKPEGSCYRFGNLKEKFLLEKIGTDTVMITNNIIPLPHVLVIKNRFDCNPADEQ